MAAEPGELITAEGFERILLVVAGVVMLAGVASGAIWSRSLGPRAAWARGLVVASLGPAAFGLWMVYNTIENRYGLDSVRALLINLAMFVLVGLGASALIGWVWERTESAAPAAAETRGTDPVK